MPRKSKPKVEQVQEVQIDFPLPEKKEKTKRNINPDTMTYIKALAIFRKNSGHKGISPKKGTKEYDEIMKIMRGSK
jgi:hypothetical protein